MPGPKQERQTASPNHSDHVWKPHKQGGPLHTACTLRAAHESVILNPGELLRILVLFMRALCAHCREVEGQLQVRNQLDPTEAHRRRGVHTRALALTHHLCAVPRDSGALTRGSATAPDGASAFRGCFRHAHLLQHSAVTRAQHLSCSPRGAEGRAPWGQGTGRVKTRLPSPLCSRGTQGPLDQCPPPGAWGRPGLCFGFSFPKGEGLRNIKDNPTQCT